MGLGKEGSNPLYWAKICDRLFDDKVRKSLILTKNSSGPKLLYCHCPKGGNSEKDVLEKKKIPTLLIYTGDQSDRSTQTI